MSIINLHNYEAFLLDYSEGILNVAQVAHLKSFLLAHPELEIDLEEFNLVYLAVENDGFEFIHELRKTEDQVPDEELINYLEGNLTLDKKIAFELKIIQDSDLAGDLEDYKKTILAADLECSLDNKLSLQKTEGDFILNNRVLAYFENQLGSSEKTEFEKELQTDFYLQEELVSYSKTHMIADDAIFYPNKESLKKGAKIIYFNLRTVGSMAAAVLLLFGLALVYNYYGNKQVESSVLATTMPSKTQIQPLTLPTATLRAQTANINVEPQKEKISSKTKTFFSAPEENLAATNTHKSSQKNNEKESCEIKKTESILNETLVVKNETLIAKDKTETASRQNSETLDSTHKINYLPLAEDIAYEDELIEVKEISSVKKGIWKRAVLIAQQANKLGVKSIDGQENSKNNYRLSFNSFSVEKK